jgi:hypothetical protein
LGSFPIAAAKHVRQNVRQRTYNVRVGRRRVHIIQTRKSLLCGAALLICTSVAFGQRADIPAEAVNVHIRFGKSKFHLGEPVLFSVMISNVGTRSFLVPSRISFFGDSQGVLSVELKNQRGKPIKGIGMAFDCSEYPPTKLLYETVLNEYLVLRPGTSYVQQMSLWGLYNDLRPGTYHLKASYSASFTILGGQRWSTEDIEKFPLQAWHGTAVANGTSFTILPSVKKR